MPVIYKRAMHNFSKLLWHQIRLKSIDRRQSLSLASIQTTLHARPASELPFEWSVEYDTVSTLIGTDTLCGDCFDTQDNVVSFKWNVKLYGGSQRCHNGKTFLKMSATATITIRSATYWHLEKGKRKSIIHKKCVKLIILFLYDDHCKS